MIAKHKRRNTIGDAPLDLDEWELGSRVASALVEDNSLILQKGALEIRFAMFPKPQGEEPPQFFQIGDAKFKNRIFEFVKKGTWTNSKGKKEDRYLANLLGFNPEKDAEKQWWVDPASITEKIPAEQTVDPPKKVVSTIHDPYGNFMQWEEDG